MAAGRSVRLDCRPLAGRPAVLVLLVWSLGYFVSIVWRNGQNPLVLQGKVNLAVSLLVLVILVLLNSPVLDSMRISVNSHMARYQSGKNTPDRNYLHARTERSLWTCGA